ncbi:RDD family protein [Tropicimonas sp. TH_r6]|uniref:RDD family protein n=1 Tax=Tropicimonas sp. TH_r6 TaxID=3082085 RepID=UPI00295472BC|nr:RDD family protein [Tropicimonas sp. TH_r6]MDV7141857.1 RDD family protein [Tropicimonas sp. TH_r6]
MSYMSEPYSGLPDPDREGAYYADIPVKRAIAWVIDAVIIALLTLPVLLGTAFIGILFYPLLWLFVSFVYRTFSIAGGSATFGMRLMSIELRNWRGEKLSLPEAFMHTLIYSVCFSFLLPQIVSMGLMLTTARAQGIHDFALGTAAVNRGR